MKVLVVAELRMGSLGLSYLNAFKNLGHEVYEFDLAKELNNKYLNRLFSGLLYRNVNRKLLEKIKVIKDDPDDDKFLEAAVEGKADYIISKDKKHLLVLKKFRNIPIMPPEEFLKII